MPCLSRIVYLHGFASGPKSRKARFFAERFRERGIEMEIPDLAEANFENLTISAQLRLIDRLVGGEPVSLIGSSLGGYLAALYAAEHAEVKKLVLLAPAFGFLDLWRARLGEAEMQRWERTNELLVYHYGDSEERKLKYQLMTDAAQYPSTPEFEQPALLFHGASDDTVPLQSSVEYAKRHPNTRLVGMDSDHELGNVLDQIWRESEPFLLDSPLAKSVLG